MNPNLADFTRELTQLTHAAGDTLSVVARGYQAATQQAMVLSYLDSFKAFGWIFLLLLPLLIFIKPGVANAKAHGPE